MEYDAMQKTNADLEEMNERLRKDIMRSLEACGSRPVGDLMEMTEAERTKWLFWNLHENLDEIRRMEPKFIGQVVSTQLCVNEGRSMQSGIKGLEKQLELRCKWQLVLTYSTYQDEQTYELGEGWSNLSIGDQPSAQLAFQENQKAYLNADHTLYPNQLFLEGWMSEAMWQEIKPQLYTSNPTCRTEILLLDNFLFPVKRGFDFVSGPAGCIGITNIEFRAFSHPTDRRMNKRGESRQRA